MAAKFHPLRVKSIEKVTAECAVLEFEVPDDLQEQFRYKQGQYLTLRADINGEDIRRSYSLCSCPLDQQWKVAVKKVEDGRFSTYANERLRPGDTLEVMPPDGRFFVEPDPSRQKNYVAFAAGSGITPIISIIKTHLELEPKATFQLFYVNQAVSTIILREELEALKNRFLDRLEIFHFLTRETRSVPLFNGRLDTEKLAILFKTLIYQSSIDDYFICGPNAMIFTIRDFLQEKGVETGKIHFELFNTEGLQQAKPKKWKVVDESQVTEVHIREGGKDFTFTIPRGSDNILDAALKQNADLPFACKGGVCCTCRAKLMEGEVDVLVNYGLEPDEIADGYILTCQAVPTSEIVKVDFDASVSKY